jgi:hypothetical protein
MNDQETNRASGGVKFRKLRIAFSVFCGLACVLLLVLWVRSYWWLDHISGQLRSGETFAINSVWGRMATTLKPGNRRLKVQSVKIERIDGLKTIRPHDWFYLERVPAKTFFVFPHFVPVMLLAALAVGPWLQNLTYRLSLRTLLIAITLMTVVLGLVVWAAK